MKRMAGRSAHFMPGMWQGMSLLCSAVRQEIRGGWLGQCFPPRPTLAQFLVNDTCACGSPRPDARQPGQD